MEKATEGLRRNDHRRHRFLERAKMLREELIVFFHPTGHRRRFSRLSVAKSSVCSDRTPVK